jgi:hypothetical protein
MRIQPPVQIGMSDEEMNRRIDKAIRSKDSVWSILEVVDKMDDVAVVGIGLTLRYRGGWSDSYSVKVPLPPDPTWNDLRVAADQAIRESGDAHHIFIEGFDLNGSELELITGS